MPISPTSRRRLRLLTLLLLSVMPLAGCVRRRMTVRSNPVGARGYVDDRQIGITPFSTEFTYYGTRKIHMERDGMKSVTVERTFHAPWYQWPVIDFFAETLWPWEVRDEREVVVQMEPQAAADPQQLLGRASAMRDEAQLSLAGSAVAPTVTPPPTIPLPNNGVMPGVLGPGLPRPANPYVGPPSVISPSFRPAIPPTQADPNLLPPTW